MATGTPEDVRLEIEVSQAFIDIAAQQTNTRCPVALSLKNCDANRIQRIKADRNEISFGLVDHDIRYVFKTPPKVRAFIDAFDTGGVVAPFKFTINTANAIDHKPIQHKSAKDLAAQGRRQESGYVRTPRAKWAKRAIHVQ